MSNQDDPEADEQRYAMAGAEHSIEAARLRKLEGLRDPHTAHYIDLIGVSEGWHCADVGAGAGSVARHLAGIVGPKGHVAAADMDPRFLDDFGGPGRSVIAHDITDGPVPGQQGLREVQSEGRTALDVGGSPGARFRVHGLQNARPLLLASGWFDDAAVDRLINMFSDPTFAYLELTWMATWGQKP